MSRYIYVLLTATGNSSGISKTDINIFESVDEAGEKMLNIIENECRNNYFYKNIQDLKKEGYSASEILEKLDEVTEHVGFLCLGDISNFINDIKKELEEKGLQVVKISDIYKFEDEYIKYVDKHSKNRCVFYCILYEVELT